MSQHARCSPSGAAGWLRCGNWLSDSVGSKYADEGTDAHTLAAWCLEQNKDAQEFAGVVLPLGHTVTDDMVEAIQRYLNIVRALPGPLAVECRLSLEPITGEIGGKGTADVVRLAAPELIVADLKYGMGVRVDAEGNEQMKLYGRAALAEFGILGPFERVRAIIIQPRLNHVSEAVYTVEELHTFGEECRAAASPILEGLANRPYNPSEKACRWCARKPNCKALGAYVQAKVGASFDVIEDAAPLPSPDATADQLAAKMAAVEIVEQWCRAVRAEVERRLLAGQPVDGWKLVQGKRGNRAWADEATAEALLKSLRLKSEQMYSFKLASPTAIEKVLKAKPKQWAKLAEHITQPDGGKSVAPSTDKRDAIEVTPVADQFQNI